MPNMNYRKGRNREYQVKRRLEKLDYYVVRSYASKGIWDLIAVGKKDVKVIQVKSSHYINHEEMERMVLCEYADVLSKEIWIYLNRKVYVATL